MSVRFNGTGDIVVNFNTQNAQVGDLATVTGNKTVEKAAAGDSLCGLVVWRNGTFAGVQIKGAMELNCSDPSITPGRCLLTPDGKNGVQMPKNGIPGVPALVVDISEDRSKLIAIL